MTIDLTKPIWQQIEDEFACPHERTETRYKRTSNNSIQYYEQCLNCGQAVTTAIAHRKVQNKKTIKPFDERLLQSYEDLKRERSDELYALQNEDWWTDYDSYLNSPQWEAKRQLALKRDNYVCQACLRRRATQVHHLPGSYRYIPHEPLFMLESVCDQCHQFITDVDSRRLRGG